MANAKCENKVIIMIHTRKLKILRNFNQNLNKARCAFNSRLVIIYKVASTAEL